MGFLILNGLFAMILMFTLPIGIIALAIIDLIRVELFGKESMVKRSDPIADALDEAYGGRENRVFKR